MFWPQKCFVDYTVEEKRTETSLLEELEQGQTEPLVFVLNANLLAMVKIVSCKSDSTVKQNNILAFEYA